MAVHLVLRHRQPVFFLFSPLWQNWENPNPKWSVLEDAVQRDERSVIRKGCFWNKMRQRERKRVCMWSVLQSRFWCTSVPLAFQLIYGNATRPLFRWAFRCDCATSEVEFTWWDLNGLRLGNGGRVGMAIEPARPTHQKVRVRGWGFQPATRFSPFVLSRPKVG